MGNGSVQDGPVSSRARHNVAASAWLVCVVVVFGTAVLPRRFLQLLSDILPGRPKINCSAIQYRASSYAETMQRESCRSIGPVKHKHGEPLEISNTAMASIQVWL